MNAIKPISAALFSSLVFGNLLFAQGTINQRERHQQRRIADGVRDGELTQNEARKLEKEQSKIHSAEAKAKADGEFTAKSAPKSNNDRTRRVITSTKRSTTNKLGSIRATRLKNFESLCEEALFVFGKTPWPMRLPLLNPNCLDSFYCFH